jgi:hypothetical protein
VKEIKVVEPNTFDIWTEWGELTRLIQSSRIAFDREVNYRRNSKEEVQSVGEKFKYEIQIKDHIKTLETEHLICLAFLTLALSICERFVRGKLGLGPEVELSGGIEAWGGKVLRLAARVPQDQPISDEWSKVDGGLAGCIEVQEARNSNLHQGNRISQRSINRFVDHGHVSPWKLNDEFSLDFDLLETYRGRLKSLMRLSDNPRRSVRELTHE